MGTTPFILGLRGRAFLTQAVRIASGEVHHVEFAMELGDLRSVWPALRAAPEHIAVDSIRAAY